MRTRKIAATVIATLALCGLGAIPASSVIAQETEKPAGCCEAGMKGGMGMMSPEKMAEMKKMHEQMEAMHEEMEKKLQQQLADLRAHAKKMESLTEEKELLTEMKKHQQMTDELLGSMVEYHEKMHAGMKEHHKHMHHMHHMQGAAPKTEEK